jgi:hypothetical protein
MNCLIALLTISSFKLTPAHSHFPVKTRRNCTYPSDPAFENKVLPFNYTEWRELNPHNIAWMPQQMSWLHRNQWVLYCQLNCACHQMKLLLQRVASLLRVQFTEKLSARQVHCLWFMCLIKTLLNARVDTLKVLKDLYFLLLEFWFNMQSVNTRRTSLCV